MKTRFSPHSTPGRLTVLASLILLALPTSAMAVSDLVISQVYGGGGNSGSVYSNDFIEIFNRGSSPISLSGKSVQYASATGNTWNVTALSARTLAPGQYFLIQQAAGNTPSTPLPQPDATGTAAMSGSTGKVVLASIPTAVSGNDPTSNVLDRIGFGPTASSFEGAPTPVLNNGTAARRLNACTDNDQNNTDFSIGAPLARNSASPLTPCGAVVAPIVTSCPASLPVAQGQAGTAALAASDADSIVSAAAITSAPVAGISLSNFMPAGAVGGSASASLQVAPTLASGLYAVDITFSNNDGQQATCTVSVGVEGIQTISQIQGAGATSPFNNTVQVTSGVVTHKVSNGFFLQDPVGDGDPATSDGIFVFTGSVPTVTVGQLVEVKGLVTEFKPAGTTDTYTELKDLLSVRALGSGTVVPVNVAFDGNLERLEGMLVNFTNTLTINQTNYLGDRGELTLSVGRRETATNRFRPRTPEAIALAAANATNVITLDDNIFVTPATVPYLGQDGTVRAGDSVTNLTGVVDFGAVGGGGATFKLQPTVAPQISRTNPRTPAPELAAGNVRVASANVLNFFTTFLDGTDAWGGTGKGCTVGGSTSKGNCRGADNFEEFERQRDKIVNSLKAIDADVVGLMEIQNNQDIAVDYLVKAVNKSVGFEMYTYVPQPATSGTDAIRVAMIYKPAKVSPVGGALSDGDAINNRAPMAQTFKSIGNGARFSVIVNHLKSKGSCGGGANADLGDGQGCHNATRVQQAQRLASYFIPQVIATSGDPDVLVIGDMNAHGFEDPINLLTGPAANLVNELERFVRPTTIPYSYVFDGESGYLDHALATQSLDRQFADATEWHNNADEPTVIDYNTDGKNAAARALSTDDAYRASDHDPVVMSLNLTPVFSDISASLALQRSGLVANRATGKYSGTITLTNTSGAPLTGPFQVRFDNLTAGVTLDGASGANNGAPYKTVASTTLAAGAKLVVNVVFSNPSKAVIGYNNTIFTGEF